MLMACPGTDIANTHKREEPAGSGTSDPHVWVFFKKSLAPLRYLMKCGQLSEWRRMNLLWIWQRSEVKGKELGWRAQRALTKENGNKEVERWGSLSPGPHGKQGSSHMCSPTLACRFLPSPTPLQLQRSLVRSFKPN